MCITRADLNKRIMSGSIAMEFLYNIYHYISLYINVPIYVTIYHYI